MWPKASKCFNRETVFYALGRELATDEDVINILQQCSDIRQKAVFQCSFIDCRTCYQLLTKYCFFLQHRHRTQNVMYITSFGVFSVTQETGVHASCCFFVAFSNYAVCGALPPLSDNVFWWWHHTLGSPKDLLNFHENCKVDESSVQNDLFLGGNKWSSSSQVSWLYNNFLSLSSAYVEVQEIVALQFSCGPP